MRFVVKNPQDNVLNLARKLGYMPRGIEGQELVFVRLLLGREYPRFHLYIKEDKEKNNLLFSLHLDQKKPSYSGSAAHSGEYKGELVEREAERIRKVIEG